MFKKTTKLVKNKKKLSVKILTQQSKITKKLGLNKCLFEVCTVQLLLLEYFFLTLPFDNINSFKNNNNWLVISYFFLFGDAKTRNHFLKTSIDFHWCFLTPMFRHSQYTGQCPLWLGRGGFCNSSKPHSLITMWTIPALFRFQSCFCRLLSLL